MHWEKINVNLVNSFLGRQRDLDVGINWIKATQTLVGCEKNGDLKFRIRLPYYFEYDEKSNTVSEVSIFNLILILVKAGTASVGFFENREVSSHKVFRAYMVRKKQGKSQIKYLKTKGKSRAGSRVRLQESLEFFEKINSRLRELEAYRQIDRVAVSCSKTLWPYLFSEVNKPPFEKKDPRLMHVPIHVPSSTHRVLMKTHDHLCTCRILADKKVVSAILQNSDDGDEGFSEDW
jgi:hypothetical protein